jgi:hypothetical protein
LIIICFLFQRHLVEKFHTTSWNPISRAVCFIHAWISWLVWLIQSWLIVRYVFLFLCGYLQKFKYHFYLLHSFSTFWCFIYGFPMCSVAL